MAKKVFACVSFLAVCAATPAFAQVQRSFVNPSFESPTLSPGSCYVQVPSSLVPGWETTHPSATGTGSCTGPAPGQTGPLIELWGSGFLGVTARNGSNFAELNAQQSSRIYQNVCFVNSEQISWKFSHRGRASATVPDVAQMKVGATGTIVQVGTTNNGTFNTPIVSQGTANTPTSGGNGWVDYSGSFSYAGANGVNSFGFESISTATGDNSVGNFLDNIQINLAPFVDFVNASSSDLEGDTGSNLLVNRPTLRVNGTVATAFTVTVKITGGTAVIGTDYFTNTATGTSTTLTVNVPAGIYDGVTTGLFQLPVYVVGNTTPQSNRDIVFTIQPPSGANPPFLLASSATCGAAVQTTWDYTIIDDDGSLAVTKTAAAPVLVSGAQYSITYTIVVNNPSAVSRTYSLTDTPSFDGDVTINSLQSLSRTTSGGSGSSGGTLLSVPQNNAGPWTLITSSRVLASGRTDTYTMTVLFTIKPGQTGNDSCGASGTGLFNSVSATVTGTGAGTFTSTACQNTPTPVWVTLNKQVSGGRVAASDQFQVRMTSGGIAVSGGSATTSGTGTSATTGQIVLPAGSTLQFSEALKTNGTGADQAPSNYSPSLSCTNSTAGSPTVPPSGSGTAQATQQQWAEFSPTAGDVLNCTITNAPMPGTLTVTKNITGGPATTNAMAFPFSVACLTPTATYAGTVNVAANATSGTTTVSIPAGSTSCTITEGTRPTAPTNYSWGTATYTQPAATAMAAGGTASGSITNPLSANPGTLTVTKNVTGGPATTSAMAFPFSVACSTPTATYTGTVNVAANATTGSTTVSVPAGSTSCTITEGTQPTAPTNYTWGAATYTQPSATAMAAGGAASGTIVNPLTRNQIAVTIGKTVTGAPTSGAPGAYAFSLTCDTGTYTGTVTLTGTATSGSTTVNVPQGATCPTLTETSKASAPTNYTWGTATTSPPAGTIATGSSGSITNPLSANPGTLTVTKNVTGGPATTNAMAFPFSVACSTPTATYTGTVNVAANATTGSTTVSIPAGSTSCTITEGAQPTAPTNYTWGAATYTQPSATAMAAGGAASGTIVNPLTRNQIAVTIGKTVTGVPASGAPGPYAFSLACDTGTYTGTVTLTGTATSGSTTVNVPQGATCSTLTETSKASAPANYSWGTETTSPPTGTIASGSSGSITNPLTANPGVLTVTKNITGGPATTNAMAFPFSVACSTPTATYTGTVNVAANATSGSTTVSIPSGSTSCTITEGTQPTAPTNYTWGAATYTQPSATAMAAGGTASGTIVNPLNANPGVLTVNKNITGGPATTNAMAFPFSVACLTPTATYTGTVNVAANATSGSTTVNIPSGSTSCTITEGTQPTAPTNYTWGAATYTQPSATAMTAGGTASGTIVNPLTANPGVLTVTKNITGGPATTNAMAFPFSVACSTPTATYAGTVNVAANATSGSTTVIIPAGSTSCTITEGTQPTAPTNYTWGAVTYTQPSATAMAAGGTASGTIVNPLTRNQIAVTIGKTVTGAPTSGAPGAYAFSLTCDTGTYTGTVTLTGTATSGSTTVNVPQGATCPTLTETSKASAPTNYTWGTATTSPPAGTITTGSSGSITNPLSANPGTLTVTKNITGGPATTSAMAFPFSVACSTPTATYTGTVNVAANATTGSTTVSIPAGSTSCTITEGAQPTAPTNYTWDTPTYTQPAATAMAAGGTASGTITNPLKTLPNITVAKTVKSVNGNPANSSTTVGAGDQIVYTLTYSNSGQTAGVGTAYEVVPQNTVLTAVSATGTTGCSLSAAAGTACQIDTVSAVPGNGATTVDITVQVNNVLPANTTSIYNLASTVLPNTCTANGACTTPPAGPSCTAPASCTNNPTSTPSVSVAKTVDASTPNPIGANQDAVFNLTVTNTVSGTTEAAGYQFYEVVPQNTTFTAISNGTTDCSLPAAPGTLCTITVTNPIVAGAPQVLKLTFHTVNPLAAGTTSLFNLATQNTTSPPSGCSTSGAACTTPPTSCPATGATCASVPTSTAAVTVAKTVDASTPNPIGAGQNAVFDLAVTNTVTGTTAAAGYQFYEVVPQQTTFTAIANGTTNCALPAAAGTLCTITVTNPIVAGAPQVLKLTFTTASPLAAGTTNIFNVATQNTSAPPSGCSASGTVCTTPPTSCPVGDTCASVPTATASVTVAKSVDASTPNPIGAGQSAVFDLTVTNTVSGTTAAAGYQFYEVVPQQTTFSAISNGTTDCALPASAGTLCTITVTNPIVAGAPQVLKLTFVTVNPLAAGTTSIFNVATQNASVPPSGCSTSGTVCTTPPTTCPASDTCASVPTATASVTVAKSVDASTPNPIGAGQNAVFDLTVTNTVTGTTAAAGYQFYEVVPQQTTFTAISNGTTDCALPAAAGTLCTITVTNPIVAGAPQVLKLTFVTANPLAAGTMSLFNVATQNTSVPPTGCSTSGATCGTPPTGPTCPAGDTCASVPTATAAVTVAKSVDASTPNPIGAGQSAVFDLTVTNTVSGTTAAAGYQFYEVVPQQTTFTAITNGTTDCALPAAAGTLCTITVTNPVVAGAAQVLKLTFTTANPLAAGTTSLFNVATQNTSTPPSGCTTSGTVCTTPPTSCPVGDTCASVPTATAAVTVAKSVDASTPNPIGAGQSAVFDLTVTNTVSGTTAAAGYQFFEVVPQQTTFTAITNGTTDCALPAAAGTLCTITVTNPIVAGAAQVLKLTFTTANPLAAGTTSLFNVATQNTSAPPSGCSASGAICSTPPTGPTCPAGDICASVPTATASVTVAKSVDASTPNPIGAGQNAVFDLTVTNTVSGTTAAAGYQFFEVVPQQTTFTAITNGTTDCALPAAAGTLCTITVTNPIVAGAPQVLKLMFVTASPLAAGTTSLFNVATQNTSTPPSGCTTSGTVCTTPPTTCPAGDTCASVPTATAAVTVAKSVDASTPNPIGANQAAVFDLTVTDTVSGTTAAAGYQFFEVVPQQTTFTAIINGTTDCALPAAAGTLCTITVTNPIVAGSPQVLKLTFTTANPLAAGTTSLFNVATQNTTSPPVGCSTSGLVCTTPPTTCPAGDTCASVPTATAAVTVAKSVDASTPNPIGAGQSAVFDLTVTNTVTGTTAASGYQFFEVVPQQTTFTAIANGTTDCALPAAAGTLCAITVTNPIVAGTAQVLKLTFVTASPLAAGTTSIFNVATQNTSTPPSGCTSSGMVCTTPPTACPAGDTCASVPTATAAVTVAKSVDASTPNPIGAGQSAVFDLTVTNTVTGTTAAAGYQFYEVVPQQTTFTAITNGTTDCALPAAAGTLCTITVTNPIVAGTPQVLKLTFDTASPLAAGTTSLFNVATQNTSTPPSGCSTSGTVCTTPPAGPTCPAGDTCASVPTTTASVTVAKTVDASTPSPIGSGQSAVFDLTVTNTVSGTTAAAGYQFFEVVPQQTTFTAIANGSTDCALPAAAGTLCTITVTNPIVAGTAQVLKLTFVTASPLAAGTTSLFNMATQNTSAPPSGCASSGRVCTTPPTTCPAGDTCASVPTAQADMQAAGPASVVGTIGTPVTVTTTCTNAGPDPAVNATCVVSFPGGTPAGATTSCTPAANPLAVGGTITCTTTFTPTNAGTVQLVTTAGSDTLDPNTGNNTATTNVITPSSAAVTAAKTLDASTSTPIVADQLIVYDLTATNAGGTAVTGYTINEVIPANTTFVSVTNGTTTATSTCTGGEAAGTLCPIVFATVPAQAGATPGTASVKVTVKAASVLADGTLFVANEITEPASCTGATCSVPPPPNGCTASPCTPPVSCPANDSHCVRTPVAIADMQANAPTTVPATIGTPVTVTTMCTNTGPNPAANATCSVTFPGGTPAGATTSCTPAANPLAVGGTITCTTIFTPTTATAVSLVTTAHSDTPDPNTANNTATTTVTPGQITPTPDMGTTPFNTPVTINVTANDTVAGSTIDPASVVPTQPAHGSVSCDASGNCTYTPNAGFTGVDTYTYSVCDHSGPPAHCGSTTVTIAVGPKANDDALTTTVNTPANSSVVGNDTYPPGSTFVEVTPPSHGTVTMNPDGTYTYTPSSNYTGTDTFTYKVCEPTPYQALCSTATVTITVAAGVSDMMATGAPTQTVPVNTPVTVVTKCTNNGPQVAVNATCTVSGPVQAVASASVGGTPVAASVAAAAAASGTVCSPTLPVASLPVGGVITCTTPFTPTQAGTYTFTTTVASDTPDSNPANDVAASIVIATAPTPSTPAQPVPLDSRWMLILMTLLLGASAAIAARRRKHHLRG